MGSSLDGSCISWSARLSLWRGNSLWDQKQNEFPVVEYEGSVCWWNPPGDVEEWEADAVFDEDGEVVHIQHRLTGKDNRRRGLKWTSWGFQDVCVHILHIVILLLRWTPSGDLTLAIGVVDVVFGREADSCNCTCAMYKQGGVTSRAVKRFKPQLRLTISEDGAEMIVAVFVCAAVKHGRGLKGTNRHMTSLLSEYSHWYILQGGGGGGVLLINLILMSLYLPMNEIKCQRLIWFADGSIAINVIVLSCCWGIQPGVRPISLSGELIMRRWLRSHSYG